LVRRDILVNKDYRDHRVILVHKEVLDILDPKDQLAILDHRAIKEIRVILEHKDILVNRDTKDFKD
jgi:hypothetical protein